MRVITSAIIAAALIGISAGAQAQATNDMGDTSNAVNVGAPDAGTATAPTNGLTTGPGATAPAADPGLGAATAPAETGAGTGTGTAGAPRDRESDIPWGLLGLLGLAGLLGRNRRRPDTDTRS